MTLSIKWHHELYELNHLTKKRNGTSVDHFFFLSVFVCLFVLFITWASWRFFRETKPTSVFWHKGVKLHPGEGWAEGCTFHESGKKCESISSLYPHCVDLLPLRFQMKALRLVSIFMSVFDPASKFSLYPSYSTYFGVMLN